MSGEIKLPTHVAWDPRTEETRDAALKRGFFSVKKHEMNDNTAQGDMLRQIAQKAGFALPDLKLKSGKFNSGKLGRTQLTPGTYL